MCPIHIGSQHIPTTKFILGEYGDKSRKSIGTWSKGFPSRTPIGQPSRRFHLHESARFLGSRDSPLKEPSLWLGANNDFITFTHVQFSVPLGQYEKVTNPVLDIRRSRTEILIS